MTWKGVKGGRKCYIVGMAKGKNATGLSRRLRKLGLKPKQEIFVGAYVKYGGDKGRAAAEARISVRTAERYLASDEVREAVYTFMDWQRATYAVKAFETLASIMEDEDAETPSRVSAAKELLNRGIGPVAQKSQHEHKHVHQVEDTSTMLDRIEELKSELGLNGKVIEGEFEEVEAPEAEERSGKRLASLPFHVS